MLHYILKLQNVKCSPQTRSFPSTANYDTRGDRVFGEIEECEKEEVWMFVRILSVEYFDDHYYAYAVDKKEKMTLKWLALMTLQMSDH